MSDTKKVVDNPFGGDSFFSGLGFDTSKKDEAKPTKSSELEALVEPTKEDKWSNDAFGEFIKQQTGGLNAEVVRREIPARPSSGRPGGSGGRPNPHARNKKRVNPANKPKPTPSATPKSKQTKTTKASDTLTKKETIMMGDSITVKEFSEKMGIPLTDVIKQLLMNKIMGGVNTSLDFDTASLIATEFAVEVKKEEESIDIQSLMAGNLQAILDLDKEAGNLKPRSPIVTVMGHVDHGKTSLLDYLRKTTVASGEAGGITQSIGASKIKHNDQMITLIDTPGHELFTSLRARGAKITDIAVVVVAVDDGCKPQTIEAINHVKASGVPFIIAITKVDKEYKQQDLDKIYGQLAEQGVTPEDRGGDTPLIKLSAHTGQGIDELLEVILLQSGMLNLSYNPDRSCVGVVVDAQKDAKQGVQTSIIVMTGTLQVGDIITVHHTYGKVKRMLDRTGKPLRVAHGGEPVQILGLQEVPEPGRLVEGIKTDKEAQERIQLIKEQEHSTSSGFSLQALLSQIQEGDFTQVNLILKADGPSSLEALVQAVDSIQLPESVTLKNVHKEVGNFTDSDLALAQATGAIMLGFNVWAPVAIKKQADQMQVTIKSYDIIYELMQFLDEVVKGNQMTEEVEVPIGKLKVLGIFFRKEKEMVIGGEVIEGEMRNKAHFRAIRGANDAGEPIIAAKGKIASLQREQQSVSIVTKGEQCGMKIITNKKILEGDILDMYMIEEVLR